jgi:hypothetical protein
MCITFLCVRTYVRHGVTNVSSLMRLHVDRFECLKPNELREYARVQTERNHLAWSRYLQILGGVWFVCLGDSECKALEYVPKVPLQRYSCTTPAHVL